MNRNYNRIVLVGNGFDLALGLETSYQSFIHTIIKDALIEALRKDTFCSSLIHIQKVNPRCPVEKLIKRIEQIKSPSDIINFSNQCLNIKIKNKFLNEIISNFHNKRWVDLEQFYYERLKQYFEIYNNDRSNPNSLLNIKTLNLDMDKITHELNNYISKIQLDNETLFKNSPLASVIQKCLRPLEKDISNLISEHNRTFPPSNVVFLNFNYTNSIIKIANYSESNQKIKHIHIHGSVNNNEYPIIFGYGDDTGNEYLDLEMSGQDELLRKIKSFHYPRSHNYHNLLSILSSIDFEVFILGHSCGLSDKTMLKTIFEHRNCLCIQNFHYKGEEEDFYKRIEVSQHFSNKALMRKKILPYDPLASIPQCNK